MEAQIIPLYRRAIRLSNNLESLPLRKKFRYNIREAFDFYQTYPDRQRQVYMFDAGKKALDTLEKIMSGPKPLIDTLFKPFSSYALKDGQEESPSQTSAKNLNWL